MSAHPRHRRRSSTVPPSLLGLLVLVCALTALAPPPAAAAVRGATPTTPSAATPATPSSSAQASSTTADDDEPVVSVAVTDVSPQIVRPDDELVVRARVRNDTEDTLDSPRGVLRIDRFRRSTRTSLERWTDQPLLATAGTEIDAVELPEPLAPGDSADVVLRVPATDLGLSGAQEAWGPRGLSVEVTEDGRREGLLRTFVLWRPTEEPLTPTRVSVLVPLTGGPFDPTAPGTGRRDPTADSEGTGPGADDGVAGDAIEDAGTDDESTDEGADGGTDATADPGAPDADATDGPGAPGTSDEDGDQTGNDTGTADDRSDSPGPSPALLGTPTQDDLDRLDAVLAATGDQSSIGWAVDPALLAAARSPDASERARAWVDTLTEAATRREVLALPWLDPDLAALAHGGGDGLAAEAYGRARAASDPVLGPTPRADLAWPADDVPDLATVGLAARVSATTVVVGDEALATEVLTYTPTGRGRVPTTDGEVTALVPDPVLARQLEAPSDTTAATAAQRILAETAVISRERPSETRHLLVTAPRDWHPDPAVARAQLAALGRAPWLELSDLTTLVDAADPGPVRAALPDRQVSDDEIPPGEIAALLTARAELAAFAAIVPDAERLLAAVDDAVLAPTSVAWRVDPVQRSAVVDAVVATLAARRAGVSVVPGSELNLISETGRFPLGLRNDLAQDATVQVVVDPASPMLVIDDAQQVTIPAGSETQVRVPFHAVGSGDVRVTVTLLSPDGTPLGPPQELTVRVRADWENVGTAVVAALVALAFLVGIVRTIRRGQTRHRGAGSTPVSEIARLPEDPS